MLSARRVGKRPITAAVVGHQAGFELAIQPRVLLVVRGSSAGRVKRSQRGGLDLDMALAYWNIVMAGR